MPEITKNDHQLVQVTLPKGNITVSPEFQRVLDEIPKYNAKSLSVQQADIKTLDEDDITELNKAMKDVTSFDKNIRNVDKAIKDTFDTPKKQMLNWFHAKLDAAGYDELKANVTRNKQVKRDVIANRANERWSELEETFNGAIDASPKIKQLAPALADFNNFRVRHPKLVSGAKNKKINDKIRSQVIHEVSDYANALEDIEANASHLLPPYQQKLLEAYVNSPSTDTLLSQTRILLSQQQAALRLQEEQKRQAELAKQQQANRPQQPISQPSPAPIQPTLQPQKVIKPQEDMTWLLNFIYTLPHGRDVHNNDNVKANVLYYMYHHLNDQGNLWNEHVGMNAEKIIQVTHYILSL